MALGTSTSKSLNSLRSVLDGRVITPEDESYEAARTPFLAGVGGRPAAIARPRDPSEVARIVTLARDEDLPLAVRSGGHDLSGRSICDGGIVIDLRDMRALDIDPQSRTASAQTGLTAGEYTQAAAAHGLATGFGDTDTVGIGGLTLGGGIGFLLRKHGLTIDSMLGAEIVTASGHVLEVDADNHPDLFWAIRGGGGNFGVATRFTFRLHEVNTVLGGMLILPATPEIIVSFIAEAEAAPDELTTMADVMVAPPMPFLPEEHHGSPVIMIRVCYAGPVDRGETVIARLRALAPPVADLVQPMPYTGIYQSGEELGHPAASMGNAFIDSVDLALAHSILEHVRAANATMASVELRVLGGAMARVAPDSTAFAHRQRKVMATVAAIYEDPAERPEQEAWVRAFTPHLAGRATGAYVNFLEDEGQDRVREAYPEPTWQRLAEIKRRYDPTNLFRLNQNVPPPAEGR